MRAMVLFTALAALLWADAASSQPAPQGDKKDAKAEAKSPATAPDKLTPTAERTRSQALKAKVSVALTDARLGDVLKEFAAQADAKADAQLMWSYGPGFPYSKKVSYACTAKSVDVALDELFKKNGGLGYVIVSKDGDKHDGWVLLTTTGERGGAGGTPEAKLSADEEADAAAKLALAKSLISGGKTEQAKTVLAFVLKKYPAAKIAAEAKELLAKLEK